MHLVGYFRNYIAMHGFMNVKVQNETEDLGEHLVNPLKPELNPIYLLALLGAHHFLHVSRIRVKLLTLR